MNCPYCQSIKTKKNGLTKTGYQQYQCKNCLKHFSDSPINRGRPAKYDKPMSDAERARNYRKRKKQNPY